jgi:hypothetical protein
VVEQRTAGVKTPCPHDYVVIVAADPGQTYTAALDELCQAVHQLALLALIETEDRDPIVPSVASGRQALSSR